MDCIQLRNYESFYDDLKDLPTSNYWNSTLLSKQYAYSSGPSYSVYQRLPEESVVFDVSPIIDMKSIKNEVISSIKIH